MDAKSKAAFINSVASGATILCSNCGAANDIDNSFCISCGSVITAPENVRKDATVFNSTEETAPAVTEQVYDKPKSIPCEAGDTASESVQKDAPAFNSIKEATPAVAESTYNESKGIFAEGLPEWSLEPPQLVVRRH